MAEFIPGKELARRFFSEVVKEIVSASFPQLRYSAGLIDYGSDVLGFDTETSTDHQWGPRLSIFLTPQDLKRYGKELDEALSQRLPVAFCGYSTNFSGTKETYIRQMEPIDHGPVKHLIRIHTLEEFFKQHLGWEVSTEITETQWLLFPQQRLLTIASGEVFHDDLGLEGVRTRLSYYPDDHWYYLMAVEWNRISTEEAFMARCGDLGDELGSQLVASRMVQSIMNLSFLQERAYIPYSKWFGVAFDRLNCASELKPILNEVLASSNWKAREHSLSRAYSYLANRHNSLTITESLDPSIAKYFDREYLVIFADRFANALFEAIENTKVSQLNRVGGIDQVTVILPLLQNCEMGSKLKGIY